MYFYVFLFSLLMVPSVFGMALRNHKESKPPLVVPIKKRTRPDDDLKPHFEALAQAIKESSPEEYPQQSLFSRFRWHDQEKAIILTQTLRNHLADPDNLVSKFDYKIQKKRAHKKYIAKEAKPMSSEQPQVTVEEQTVVKEEIVMSDISSKIVFYDGSELPPLYEQLVPPNEQDF